MSSVTACEGLSTFIGGAGNTIKKNFNKIIQFLTEGAANTGCPVEWS